MDINTFGQLTIGMTAETTIVVAPEMTIAHFVPGMPHVYSTPTMILHMEIAAGFAIASSLQTGLISVGMGVNIRHLAATPVGGTVRATARVIGIEGQRVLFAVEAWNGDRKIGDGTHRRGIVNADEFAKRYEASEELPAPPRRSARANSA
jgi:predicted thioesterase